MFSALLSKVIYTYTPLKFYVDNILICIDLSYVAGYVHKVFCESLYTRLKIKNTILLGN